MAQVSPEQVVSGLVSRGYAPHEAAGIAGNIAQESGFDTGAREVNPQTESAREQGGGFGLAQWTSKERKQGLYSMAQMRGVPVDDLDLQLDYLDHELKTTHKKAYKALKSTRDPRHAAWVVSKYYEVPSENHANNPKRMGLAEQFINLINPINSAQADEMPWQEPDKALMDEYSAWKSSKQPDQSLMDEYKAWKEGKQPTSVEKWWGEAKQNLTDEVGGVVRGAGSIGATLLTPVDAAARAMGLENSFIGRDDRRKAMDEGLRSMGVNTESGRFSAAKIGSEIAGTGGMGKILAGGAKAVPALSKLAPALESWGMEGTALQRIAGGAATGGASSALIDPETAATGAALGGALPPGIQVAGKVGQLVGNAVRSMTRPQIEKLAEKMATMTGKTSDEVADILTNQSRVAEIDGLINTAPQILQDPNISQIARAVKTNSSMALSNAEQAQQQAYRNTLEGIAPIGATVQDAADKAGSSISKSVQGDYKAATKAVSAKFNDLRKNEDKLVTLPLDKMRATVDEYLGKGSIDQGETIANKAIKVAEDLSEVKPVQGKLIDAGETVIKDTRKAWHNSPVDPENAKNAPKVAKQVSQAMDRDLSGKVNFKELQNFRSSLGKLANKAKVSGDTTEHAAFNQMVKDIDGHLDELANNWEGVSPIWLDKYKDARKLHADKQNRFKTGAQSGLFKPKSNGEMAVEGGQIPGKFYSIRDSQSRDMQSFKRLVANKPELIKDLKEFALTKAGQTATATGNLANGYVKWAKSHSGANKELFTAAEKAKIDAVAKHIGDAAKSDALGMVKGSDTAQKAKSVLDLGFIDNKALNVLAQKIPMGNSALSALKEASGRERSSMLAELLADPDKFAATLRKAKTPRPQGKALEKTGKALSRGIPAAAQVLGRD
jgi:Phage tail lysozyme